MANKSFMKYSNPLASKLRSDPAEYYMEVSRSRHYPFSSTRQDSKKYAEFDSCGRKTIGRVARDGSK